MAQPVDLTPHAIGERIGELKKDPHKTKGYDHCYVLRGQDGKLALAVLPASYIIDLSRLQKATGAPEARVATEQEFRELFPECETGAMPPFGNLYGMNVFVDQRLREDEEIAFNAGSHTELIKLSYRDFERLVNPIALEFSVSPHKEAKSARNYP